MNRQQRIEKTANIIAKREKFAKTFKVNRPRNSYRDRAPLDCGHSNCGCCHSEKINNEQNKYRRRQLKKELQNQEE
jgi:hypothetical protein